MAFEVTRTSHRCDPVEKTDQVCQDARAKLVTFVRERAYEEGSAGWWYNGCKTTKIDNRVAIELNSLDDLLAFVASVGEEVIITTPYDVPDDAPFKHTLEIYDFYRE